MIKIDLKINKKKNEFWNKTFIFLEKNYPDYE